MKETTLYEAANDFISILENIDPETGEIPQEFGDIKSALEFKCASVAAWILDNECHAEMLEAHANKILIRAKSARRKTFWAKNYLQNHMKNTGVTSIKSECGTFMVKLDIDRDESVCVFDAGKLDSNFYKKEEVKHIDRRAIKEAIKNGIEVSGAKLIKNDRLTIK